MRWAWTQNGELRWGWYVWPGLAALWLRGSWAGLACAAVFALLLNVTIATSYVWTEVVAAPLRDGLWALVVVGWLAGIVVTRRGRWRPAVHTEVTDAEDLFPSALGEYLRGNWVEAEKLIGRILDTRPEDAETRLLWASVLRRTRRHDEARRRLAELRQLDTAARWRWEIDTEWEQIERDIAEETVPPANDVGTGRNEAA